MTDVRKSVLAAIQCTPAQRNVLQAVLSLPVRMPAIGMSSDAHLHVSWRFSDRPYLTFTLEVLSEGSIEWFFLDRSGTKTVDGSDVPVRELPEIALAYLRQHFPL